MNAVGSLQWDMFVEGWFNVATSAVIHQNLLALATNPNEGPRLVAAWNLAEFIAASILVARRADARAQWSWI